MSVAVGAEVGVGTVVAVGVGVAGMAVAVGAEVAAGAVVGVMTFFGLPALHETSTRAKSKLVTRRFIRLKPPRLIGVAMRVTADIRRLACKKG